MTRPLRIDVEGGWYHVMSRGIERRVIFPDESYCAHFLELLGSMSERFAVEAEVRDTSKHMIPLKNLSGGSSARFLGAIKVNIWPKCGVRPHPAWQIGGFSAESYV